MRKGHCPRHREQRYGRKSTDEPVFNLTIRRFLKEPEVSSQREIEIAVHKAIEQEKLQSDQYVVEREIALA